MVVVVLVSRSRALPLQLQQGALSFPQGTFVGLFILTIAVTSELQAGPGFILRIYLEMPWHQAR